VWAETGGPPVKEVPDMVGFGSRMISRAVQQLGGTLSYDWQPRGVVVTIAMERAKLAV